MNSLIFLFYIIPILYSLWIISNICNKEYNTLSFNEIFFMFLLMICPIVNFLILVYNFRIFIFPKIISFVKK